ncbi:angiotensinogen [Lampris incognitus]|uniref:angiotensinogen n=1 Tax=Lampris incognitus TaxID=2546036 RepID=UPI0024B596B2|nr:angiotensinogen [Lampris incognitus]XP_056147813.1 angiotensinogen [Lampris incognitus]
MQKLRSPSLLLLFCCCLSGSQANRVYVHPFYLFAADNVSCETLQTQTSKSLETLPVATLDNEVQTPDSRDPSDQDGLRQNITQRTAVLAGLSDALGLRMYQALSSAQSSINTLLSPVNTFGSLITFYMGASKKTARSYQLLLGLNRHTDGADCVSLVDGHKVLRTLQSINSLVDDGPKDEIDTQVWAFAPQDARLSEDFIKGTQDFSDTSFIRGVDFSRPQKAEVLLNTFVEKTSEGRVKRLFSDLSSSTNLLFISSISFKGNWKTAFQPEKTTLQAFHVDEATIVMVPMMTHTGQYQYFNDKKLQCTVVKLALSKRSYMLLVVPHEGASLDDIGAKLNIDVISDWHRDLKEGLLELSLPKFSMSSVNELHDLLTKIDPEVETELLGSRAEFDRLTTTKPFTVDKVFNKVLFEMSEEGSETQNTSPDAGVPLKLSINRPFFFSVTEGNSNAILLLGRVSNPAL